MDPSAPPRIQRLPFVRGHHVPWFVQRLDGDYEFRLMDSDKVERAALDPRWSTCWVCGEPTGSWRCWVVGPMCTLTLSSAEPHCHVECAEYAVRACPFLRNEKKERRETGLPDDVTSAGNMIRRNPGCGALWVARRMAGVIRDENGLPLWRLPFPPERVDWRANGREATRDEVLDSIQSGAPLLREMGMAEDMFKNALARIDKYLPRK